ncbi:MAG: hypothetical protein FJY36_06605 [Betaproteobacteria bacterium]|nr:hypothetical protein [Betaproteobacteria bacterium]
MKTLHVAWLWALASLALAQPLAEDPSARIAAERAQLQAERQDIEQAHTARNRECWQRFAVNACLSEVRRSRRDALAPIRARELASNAEEREWRTRQRDERLREKAEGSRP